MKKKKFFMLGNYNINPIYICLKIFFNMYKYHKTILLWEKIKGSK